MTGNRAFQTLKIYGLITLASAIYALSFVWCYEPNNIAFGGITGVAQLINYLLPVLPVGATVIALNIPLFLLGWRLLGGKLLVSSLFAMAVSSIFIDVLAPLWNWEPMDPLLACIIGGVLMGLSLGLVFRQGATTGGTDLLARLLKLKLAWLPMGRLLMLIDLAVILSVAAAFRSLNSALYGLVALAISSYAIDRVLYGVDSEKVAYIISDRWEDISAALLQDLDRGVTILQGQGGYSHTQKNVLMCAFKQRQIVRLKQMVTDIDPGAFLIVCPAFEVLGDGFRIYSPDDL